MANKKYKNPETDILGSLNVGIDTCWLNVNRKEAPINIISKYQIANLFELKKLLFDSKNFL